MELIQNKEGLVATLTVKVSQKDYATQVEKELRKLRQTSLVKGFRPGNAPMSLIKKMYGQSIIVEEVNKLLTESIKNYEQENVGHLFGQVIPSANNVPVTDLNEQKDFEFIYEAGFVPEFTYKIDENTELPYYNIIVEDEAIDAEISAYRNLYSVVVHADEVQDDCLVDVDTTLLIEGKEHVHNACFLMAVMPDEYKSLFYGAKLNDVINVEIRKVFTNETDLTRMLKVNKEELALQPEILPFTVVKIKKKILAELNQDFFDKVAGKDKVHNEDELKEYLKTALTSAYETMSLDRLYEDSIKVLNEKTNISMPEDFIGKYIRFIQKENTEMSDEDFDNLTKYYVNESKWNYIITSLLEQNQVVVTYEMVINEAKRMFKQNFSQRNKHYSDEDINGMVNYYLQNEDYAHGVLNTVKNRQLAVLLKKYAKLNVTDVMIDEFYEINNKKANPETVNPENQENNKEEAQA
jgi:trigger factor